MGRLNSLEGLDSKAREGNVMCKGGDAGPVELLEVQ